MDDPFRVFEQIRQAYLRYLDSPFRLRYDALRSERRSLLDRDRQLYREPLIEPIPPYKSSELTVGEACARLGVPTEAADFLTRGLFWRELPLHQHQFDAWERSRFGQGVVVTSGTGSGKTECYLLPVFAYLVEDLLRGWGAGRAQSGDTLWWRRRGQSRVGQRTHEPSERPAAVRALLLYPLNSLIEDQLSRIRRACDGTEARGWFSGDRANHRFWFGRYNSVTPVSGSKTRQQKRQELRNRLTSVDNQWAGAMTSVAARGDRRILDYFQNPEGSEMWSRWGHAGGTARHPHHELQHAEYHADAESGGRDL